MKTTAKEFALVSQLQDEGIPFDGEVLEEMRAAYDGLELFQDPMDIETGVRDLDSGGTGYMLSIAIHNKSQRSIRLHEPRLKIPWRESEFHWIEDPRRKAPREYTYSFPDPGPTGFERDAVLNHRFGRRDSRLGPDGWIEGLLLGVGREPIPEEYRDRQRLNMLLSICDGRGNEYEHSVAFLVSRSKRRSGSIAKEIKRGILFASLDGRRTEVGDRRGLRRVGLTQRRGGKVGTRYLVTGGRWIHRLAHGGRFGPPTQPVAAK